MISTYRRLLVGLAVPAALVGATLNTAGTAQAAVPGPPQTLMRTYAAGQLDWTVPVGTYSISLTAVGGSGGDGSFGAGVPGGNGGHADAVSETVSVTPGQVVELFPGSAGFDAESGAIRGSFNGFGYYGGAGGLGDLHGNGGGGGAASMVMLASNVIAVAGGGGGGGGGGAVYPYAGGTGGDARYGGAGGSGAGSGSGGSGNRIGATEGGYALDADTYTSAGGGGGGGGGWDGNSLGGGIAGSTGTYGGGGGGGGAGGQSFAGAVTSDIETSGLSGDGYITLSWRPGVATTSTLAATPSAPQGHAITLSDTIGSSLASPVPTGTVTFEEVDPYTYSQTVLAVIPLGDGKATFSSSTLGLGTHAVHASYSGDETYQPSTSGYAYPKVTAAITTISVNPAALAFGYQALDVLATKTVTLTNTGTIAWYPTSAATDNGDVNLPATTCGYLAPGATCQLTVSFQPRVARATTATITLTSNFGPVVVPVTGTGVAPPAITSISPASGRSVGGTRIKITGTNFVKVSAIKINGAVMKAVSCASFTSCTATTPAGTGTLDIQVTALGRTSAKVAADRFRYTG